MELSKRKSPRLPGYDYSSNGAYFVTVCTYNRQNLFSRIVGAIHESPLQKRSVLSNAIGYLKMNASRDIHKNGYAGKIWQRSYHDHIIRGERDYLKIWEYIENNPKQWEMDYFYVEDN